jgi:hypothetical protein
MTMWKKAAAIGGIGFVAPVSAYMLYLEATHGHEEKVYFPHMKARKKAFPWSAHDCDLFDGHCKHDYAAAKKGEPTHH